MNQSTVSVKTSVRAVPVAVISAMMVPPVIRIISVFDIHRCRPAVPRLIVNNRRRRGLRTGGDINNWFITDRNAENDTQIHQRTRITVAAKQCQCDNNHLLHFLLFPGSFGQNTHCSIRSRIYPFISPIRYRIAGNFQYNPAVARRHNF